MKTTQRCRVVLLDPDDRVLLIRIDGRGGVTIDGRVTPDFYWITVGGGLDDGETFEEAAHREVFEESGISDMTLGPVLWDREADINWKGEQFHSVERYFAARTGTTAISLDHLEDDERIVFQEHRWWTHAEIIDTDRTETIFPDELSDLLERARGFDRG